MFQWKVAIIIAIEIGLAGFGGIDMSEVFKVKSEPLQFVFAGFGSFFCTWQNAF